MRLENMDELELAGEFDELELQVGVVWILELAGPCPSTLWRDCVGMNFLSEDSQSANPSGLRVVSTPGAD
jgi:hypothetical protein